MILPRCLPVRALARIVPWVVLCAASRAASDSAPAGPTREAVWVTPTPVLVAPSIVPVRPSTVPASAARSGVGDEGGATLAQAVIQKISVPVAGRSEPTCYWLRRPAGHGPRQRPPLMVCLHGTDDTGRDMLDFWGSLRTRLPVVLAAPQGVGKGWREDDVPGIGAMLGDLRQHVPFDDQRVLLVGFSAGGAMTLQLLYAEKFPATMAAALANYVPPHLREQDIHDRRQIPVFYAVGIADVNYERMRAGLEYLRSAGANVELYRPPIGHRLDPAVAQTVLDWFFDQCARQQVAAIAQAETSEDVADAAATLARVVTQERWHEPEHVARAGGILAKIEAPGRQGLASAQRMIGEGRQTDAIEALQKVADTYGTSRLGQEARALRQQLEADPRVREEYEQRLAQRRASEALSLYAGAQRLVAQNRFRAATEQCQLIVQQYGDTPSAKRAQYLLDLLKGRTSP